MATYESLTTDWTNFQRDLSAATQSHNEYLQLLRDLTKRQEASSKTVKHLSYVFKQLQQDLKKFDSSKEPLSDEQQKKVAALRAKLSETRVQLDEMARELPASNIGQAAASCPPYLTVILGGNLNVSLLNPDDRYKYKEDYERFKANVTYVIISTLILAFFFPYRAVDAICNFLMVWYYCTLTIREAILRVNGSRIKGWWMLHHYIACVLCGITLTWRDRACYKDFRPLFLVVSFYICALQIMQSKYQTGCLRRLHALGQRYAMDVTLEGFSSWMFKGLTFLLPFLIIGYLIQGYCSWFLFNMYYQKDCSEDWQVLALAILFLVISCGNLFTILSVFIRKLSQIKSSDLAHLAAKYRPKID